jgi:hypothetical protein
MAAGVIPETGKDTSSLFVNIIEYVTDCFIVDF